VQGFETLQAIDVGRTQAKNIITIRQIGEGQCRATRPFC
jgi:hypothetical protein